MAGVIETITKVFAGSRYRAVSPPLPVERVIECPGRFSFGVPWPWEEVVQDGSLVDATGEAVATQMLAFVWAPRTDGAQAVFSAWAESGQVNLDQPTLPGQLTGLYRARLIGSRRAAAVDSKDAELVRVALAATDAVGLTISDRIVAQARNVLRARDELKSRLLNAMQSADLSALSATIAFAVKSAILPDEDKELCEAQQAQRRLR